MLEGAMKKDIVQPSTAKFADLVGDLEVAGERVVKIKRFEVCGNGDENGAEVVGAGGSHLAVGLCAGT